MTCKGGVLIVRPAGPRLGEGEACVISSEVRAAMQDLGTSMVGLVIDLSEVQIMSSFGLGLCIELRNCARSTRLGTILFGLSQELRDLFRLVKIDRLFAVALTPRDLAEAISS